MGKIRIGIYGVGNCASSLVQGVYFYNNVSDNEPVPGLMNNVIGGYRISDIEIVSAFDIDSRKIGKDVSEAIFAKPNNTVKFSDVPETGTTVMKSPVMDGVAAHMSDFPADKTFAVDKGNDADVVDELKKSKTDILINYLPVGSEKAARFAAQCCLEAGCGFVNAMPVFIASDSQWQQKFSAARLPIVGDDIKAQVGATIVNRTLARLFADRGVKIDRMYQLNVGGNTDFMNMLARDRLASKKKSKMQAVKSIIPDMSDDDVHIGPSDYVPWLKDRKLCFLRIEGRKFGNVPVDIEVRLNVEDSPNSAGVMIDAVRCCKLGLDRKIGGPLISPSSYFMKSPPEQFVDSMAKQMTEEFIKGKREN